MVDLTTNLVGSGGWWGLAGAWCLWLSILTVHGALWFGLAALFARDPRRSFAARYRLWRIALIGALASSIAAACGAVSWGLDVIARAAGERVATLVPDALTLTAAQIPLAMRAMSAWTPLRVVVGVLASVSLVASCLGVVWWLGAAFHFLRNSAARRPMRDSGAGRRLAVLLPRSSRHDVRLTESARAESPMALGRREICLPASLEGRLDDAEWDGVLAHELAHLERGDGLWFPVLSCMRAVLWFHPLVRWATSELSRTAELACDERATELTQDPLGLAQVITRLATELAHAPRMLSPAMSGSALRARRWHLAFRVQHLIGRAETLSAKRLSAAAGARGGATWLWVLGLLSLAMPLRAPGSLAPRRGATLGSSPADADSHPSSPSSPDPSEEDPEALSRTLAELGAQARDVEARLNHAHSAVATESTSSNPDLAFPQLEQDLRHVHAMQAWTERRLVGAVDRAAHAAHP